MRDPRKDDMPTVTPGWDDDDPDVRVTYSAVEGELLDYGSAETSTRTIEATIIEERDDKFEVELDVVDNTNVGVFAMGGATTNHPGGDYEEFTETVSFDKSDIPYYQDDFPEVRSHIPKGERIVPLIKEWSDNKPFRA